MWLSNRGRWFYWITSFIQDYVDGSCDIWKFLMWMRSSAYSNGLGPCGGLTLPPVITASSSSRHVQPFDIPPRCNGLRWLRIFDPSWSRAVSSSRRCSRTLEDAAIIEEQAEKADIVINVASCDHGLCAKAVLAGLDKRSVNNPEDPPLLLHVSGTGILSDNARGEVIDNVTIYSDLDLDLKSLPADNAHLEIDLSIVEAGTRKENPIRTAIIYPVMIYGVGEGVQKTTAWLRAFLEFAKLNKHAGTWGRGLNSINNVHVKDVASAIFTVLTAALEHRADEGAQGLYFAASDEPKVSWYEWMAPMGDYLYSKGIVAKAGSHPFSDEFIESIKADNLSRGIHSDGWSLFGGNQFSKPQRLARLGWEPVETKKHPMLSILKESVDAALEF
ncbi:unnamed protein product [Somion occarium]|uniref:NAD-dependent epimerase/dehydratase domain-containing protein n=1 Tax=Somion occarium TaxID=3059160 RepID=A0ABP1D6E8_9APHY